MKGFEDSRSPSGAKRLSDTFKPLLRHLRDVAHSMRGVKVGATAFRLPLGLTVRVEELWMREAIARLLPDTEGIFLDIGVNLGQTLLSLRSVDRSRRYIGFEPNADCVSAVRRIIHENSIEHSTVIPAACSGKFGISRLFHYTNSRFDTTGSMVPQYRDAAHCRSEAIIVQASVRDCLESLEVDRLGLVKIDVEGFEADVLEALELMIAKDGPPILIEVLPIRESAERQAAADRIVRFISRLNYAVFRIDKDDLGRFVGFTRQDRIGSQIAVEESDFLLCLTSSAHAADQGPCGMCE